MSIYDGEFEKVQPFHWRGTVASVIDGGSGPHKNAPFRTFQSILRAGGFALGKNSYVKVAKKCQECKKCQMGIEKLVLLLAWRPCHRHGD